MRCNVYEGRPLHERPLDLAGFCEKRQPECPSDPCKYVLCPASHQEAGLFYSQMDRKVDASAGAIIEALERICLTKKRLRRA